MVGKSWARLRRIAEESAELGAGTVASKPMKAARTNSREAFLRSILKKKGFSIHDLAKQANVDFHTADNYLKGKSQPYPSTLKKLADALGIEVTKLPA